MFPTLAGPVSPPKANTSVSDTPEPAPTTLEVFKFPPLDQAAAVTVVDPKLYSSVTDNAGPPAIAKAAVLSAPAPAKP